MVAKKGGGSNGAGGVGAECSHSSSSPSSRWSLGFVTTVLILLGSLAGNGEAFLASSGTIAGRGRGRAEYNSGVSSLGGFGDRLSQPSSPLGGRRASPSHSHLPNVNQQQSSSRFIGEGRRCPTAMPLAAPHPDDSSFSTSKSSQLVSKGRRAARAARTFSAGIALALAVRLSTLAPAPALAALSTRSVVKEEEMLDLEEEEADFDLVEALQRRDEEERHAAEMRAAAAKAVSSSSPATSQVSGGGASSGLRKNQFAVWTGISSTTPSVKRLQWYEDSSTFFDNQASKVAMTGFGAYMLYRARASAVSLNKQRKRVRGESEKLKQLAEEWMGVEGEASYDEDIMLELRKMKEDRTSAGSKYAKETRKHNPDFAAEKGEVDKLDEASFQERGIKHKGKKKVDADELLGMGDGGDGDGGDAGNSAGTPASSLQNLFDSSPEEDEED